MLQYLLPVGILVLGGIAYSKATKKEGAAVHGAEENGGLTPERAVVYREAIKTVLDPAKLRKLAVDYRNAGLTPQADMLDKRARLRELPKDVKLARAAIFRRAMASTDKAGILRVANAYEADGATGAADHLRDHAATLGVAA
jgi:hypothetical protein